MLQLPLRGKGLSSPSTQICARGGSCGRLRGDSFDAMSRGPVIVRPGNLDDLSFRPVFAPVDVVDLDPLGHVVDPLDPDSLRPVGLQRGAWSQSSSLHSAGSRPVRVDLSSGVFSGVQSVENLYVACREASLPLRLLQLS